MKKIQVAEVGGFLIEVEDSEIELIKEQHGVESGDEPVGGLSDKLHAVNDTISMVCNYAMDAFNDNIMPDEFSLEFGIKLSGEKGLPLVAKGKAEASLLIKATWKKDKNVNFTEPSQM